MAASGEIAGKTGALYYSTATLRDTTISFAADTDRISDSKERMISAGFETSDKIVVTGAGEAGNNDTWTVDEVGAAFLSVTGELTLEAAGNEITIKTAPDDAQLLGFFNWSFNQNVGVEEITDFDDTAGGSNNNKIYLPIIKDWTGTAEAYWLTGAYDDFLGTQKWVRFFVKWVTTPSGENPSYYYEGMCDVTGVSTDEPIGGVVKQSITFQGDGVLTLVTRTTEWDT